MRCQVTIQETKEIFIKNPNVMNEVGFILPQNIKLIPENSFNLNVLSKIGVEKEYRIIFLQNLVELGYFNKVIKREILKKGNFVKYFETPYYSWTGISLN